MSHIGSRVKLVLFDLGDVLSSVDERGPARGLAMLTNRTEEEVFDAVFSPASKALMETGHQSWPEFSAQVNMRLGANVSISDLGAAYLQVLKPNTAMFPIVQATAESHRIGLCSNTSQIHWLNERPTLPFADKPDPVVLSYEVGVMKPARRIYEAVVNQARIQPQQILFVDDKAENVDGARNAGLRSTRFTGVGHLGDSLRRIGVKLD